MVSTTQQKELLWMFRWNTQAEKRSSAWLIQVPVFRKKLWKRCSVRFTGSTMRVDAKPAASDWDWPSPNARCDCMGGR